MTRIRRNRWLLVPMALVVLAAICGLLLSVMLGIGAFYNPYADGSAFAPLRFWIASAFVVIAVLVLLGQAVVLSRMTRRVSAAFVLGYGALYSAAMLIGSALSVPPDSYVRYVVDQPYLVPRHYSPGGQSQPGPESGLWAEFCTTSGQPVYADTCRHEMGFPRVENVQLTPKALTDAFRVSFALSDSGIRFDGDQITGFAARDRIAFWSYDGLDGFSARNTHYLMDDERRLLLAAYCAGDQYCTVHMAVPEGTLRFPSRGGVRDPRQWIRDAELYRQLIESWRCLSPACAVEIRE